VFGTMASYQSRFDPPPRPDPDWKPNRLGNSTQISSTMAHPSGQGRRTHRDADATYIPRETEHRPEQPRYYGRHTGMPKPSSRGPSPAPEIPVVLARPAQSSGFGFRRTATASPAVPTPPVLKPKHSRNVLRRKASSIAQHTTIISPPEPSYEDSTFPIAFSPTPPPSHDDFNSQSFHMSEDYYLDAEEKNL
jgi:hypothetical protein